MKTIDEHLKTLLADAAVIHRPSDEELAIAKQAKKEADAELRRINAKKYYQEHKDYYKAYSKKQYRRRKEEQAERLANMSEAEKEELAAEKRKKEYEKTLSSLKRMQEKLDAIKGE